MEYNRGFTLIETLIYVAIFGLMIGALSTFLQTIGFNRVNYQIVSEVNNQGNRAISIITQTLRNATAINTPATSASSTTLSLNTGIASTTPTVFSQSSGVLYMSEGSNPTTALTNNRVSLSGLTFYNLSLASTSGTVRFSFNLQNLATSTQAQYNYSASFYGSGTLRP